MSEAAIGFDVGNLFHRIPLGAFSTQVACRYSLMCLLLLPLKVTSQKASFGFQPSIKPFSQPLFGACGGELSASGACRFLPARQRWTLVIGPPVTPESSVITGV